MVKTDVVFRDPTSQILGLKIVGLDFPQRATSAFSRILIIQAVLMLDFKKMWSYLDMGNAIKYS